LHARRRLEQVIEQLLGKITDHGFLRTVAALPKTEIDRSQEASRIAEFQSELAVLEQKQQRILDLYAEKYVSQKECRSRTDMVQRDIELRTETFLRESPARSLSVKQ